MDTVSFQNKYVDILSLEYYIIVDIMSSMTTNYKSTQFTKVKSSQTGGQKNINTCKASELNIQNINV